MEKISIRTTRVRYCSHVEVDSVDEIGDLCGELMASPYVNGESTGFFC